MTNVGYEDISLADVPFSQNMRVVGLPALRPTGTPVATSDSIRGG